MALKKSEKQLLGLMLFVGAAAALFLLGLPGFTGIQTAWGKKTELETNLKNLSMSESAIQSEIATLQQQMKLPNDIFIRKHTPDSLQANVKEILNKVIQMASNSDNTIIALTPWKEVQPIIAPPTPDPAAASASAAPAATAGTAVENAPPPPPAVPPLTVVGYELSMRGSFQSIQTFLRSMDKQKELVELSSIQIVNEQGPDRGAATPAAGGSGGGVSDSPLVDSSKPIKLIAKLRLVLEPVSPTATSASIPEPPDSLPEGNP